MNGRRIFAAVRRSDFVINSSFGLRHSSFSPFPIQTFPISALTSFTTAELEAYLDEALPVEQMTAIERALRSQPDLAKRLSQINGRRDAGVHSLGEVWRRQRLTCATRRQLGSYLLGVLPDEEADYIRFHIDTVGCRFCAANLADLQAQQAEAGDNIERRRRKYFQSSAGFLRKC
jgi:hypothetical protein